MKSLRVGLMVCLFAALSACTRAPGEEALKTDIQQLLETNFAPGLFDVAAARRANDFPFVLPGENVRVRYDATLRLKRDHRFGAWDQINIGVLSLLLDAKPEEIEGIKSAGNTAGDTLTLRGRIAYIAANGTLKLDTRAPAAAGDDKSSFVLLSDFESALENTWATLKEEVRASRLGLILDEWSDAQRSVAGRGAREDGGFAVATDRKDSVYWRIGQAVEVAAHNTDIPFENIEVSDEQEALDFLRDGRASAIMLRNTAAALAIAGAAPYDASGPYHLTALAALYPEPVHVVVKADSPLGSPADLFGKHVGVAGTARVNAAEAEAILRGHGIPLAQLATPLIAVPPEEALDQLDAGAFDALVMTSPLPSTALRTFATRKPLRLLPFDSDAIAFLTSGQASYVAITIPGHTYPGQLRPLAAVAAVTMLVSVDTVPAKEAANLLDLMLAKADYLSQGSVAGLMIGRNEARRAMTLAWHPGAPAFFDPALKDQRAP